MKNSNYKINHGKGIITITKSFSKKASEFGSTEYGIIKGLRNDFPDYKVTIKEIKKNPHKKTYAKLTYENMEKYIECIEPNNLASLEIVIRASKIQPSPYAYVKKWFLETYSDYREYSAVIEEAAENLHDAAAA